MHCAVWLAALLGLGAPAGAAAENTYRADVRVTSRVLNTVRPALFGDNIEWVHNGMGLWRPAEKRLDDALVAELRAAGITHLRYPGGTLSDYFDWRAAVGPLRTPQPNPFEEGRTQLPAFGPDEFALLCRRLGIPATITVNAGTGTPEMAGQWAADLKRKGVRVSQFEVGNEIYMAEAAKEQVPSLPVARTPESYAAFYLQASDAIRNAYPGARVGAIGLVDTGVFALGKQANWLPTLLARAGHRMDFLAVHNGYAPAAALKLSGGRQERQPDEAVARSFMAASEYVRANLQATRQALARHAPGKRIPLHITEYGPLVYPLDPGRAAPDLAWNRSLAGALYQACLFHVLVREPLVESGNHLPLVQDVFGALVGIRGTGAERRHWRNAVFHVFRLYGGMGGRRVRDVTVKAPTFDAGSVGIVPELKGVPLVEAAAFGTRDGKRLRVFLVNRDLDRAASVRLDPGLARYRVEGITTLAAATYRAENTPERPNTVRPAWRKGAAGTRSGPLAVTVPRHALVAVDLRG